MNLIFEDQIAEDGIMGENTIKALEGYERLGRAFEAVPELNHRLFQHTLLFSILEARVSYYAAITDGKAATKAKQEQEIKNRSFFRGWLNRISKWFV